MGCAEIISFTDVRASRQWDTLRQQLHTRFDQWLDTLEEQLGEPCTTLAQISTTVWGLRQALTGGITETIITHAQEGERQRMQALCPQCAHGLKRQDQVKRTVETLVGPVALERPYCYCRACREGSYPLDEALGLVTGCKQLDMQHAAAKLATEVPYGTAQALFGDLTGDAHRAQPGEHGGNGTGRRSVPPGDRAAHCRGRGRPLSPSSDGPGH